LTHFQVMILCLWSGSKQLVWKSDAVGKMKVQLHPRGILNSDFVGMAEQHTELADLVSPSGAVSTAVASAITEALSQLQRQSCGEAGSMQAKAVPTPQSRAGSSSR